MQMKAAHDLTRRCIGMLGKIVSLLVTVLGRISWFYMLIHRSLRIHESKRLRHFFKIRHPCRAHDRFDASLRIEQHVSHKVAAFTPSGRASMSDIDKRTLERKGREKGSGLVGKRNGNTATGNKRQTNVARRRADVLPFRFLMSTLISHHSPGVFLNSMRTSRNVFVSTFRALWVVGTAG